jgi:HD superfamily phosphohydrolase
MLHKKISTPKVIADPIYGIFDVRPVLAMIETKEFQSLGDKRQLGMSYLIFPSATHTRRAHSLGTYHAARVLADRWTEFGMVKKDEADALAGYALYHDIGHPTFSHVTEGLCLEDNDNLGIGIIRRLKKEIEACGIKYAVLEKLARHENPLYLGVHDKNLGMDKLDYLERDGMFTILSRPAGVEYLRRHIYFVNGELAIDEKVIDNAIDVQNFYLKMYKNVYLRKASAIAQRMMQKTVYHLISAGEVKASDLPLLTDSELIGIIYFSKDPVVKFLYGLLKSRELFRETIVIRPESFARNEPKQEKAKVVFGVAEDGMDKLMTSNALGQNNMARLEKLEDKIAEIAEIPKNNVLLVPVFDPKRFTAKDIKIYTYGGKLDSLKERHPAHFKNMEEVAQSYFALRICTLEKYRKILSAPRVAKQAFDLVMKTE